MGLIYKITNCVNQKVYIGKTIRSLDIRWKEHLKDMTNPQKNNNKLYRAMNKYGIKNFTIEVLEDNIEDDLLNAKEQEYIQLFNSYYKGYNCTFGGDGESTVDKNLLKQLFLQGKNYTEIAQITGHTRKTVAAHLQTLGYSSPVNHNGYQGKGKAISFNNQHFESLTLLAKYLQANIVEFQQKKIPTIIKGISKSAINGSKYCGYYFYYI